jgi:hypothetical protein
MLTESDERPDRANLERVVTGVAQTRTSRRELLALGAGGLGVLLGFGGGRLTAPGLRTESAASSQPTSSPERPAMLAPFLLDLRRLKPWNIVAPAFFFTHDDFRFGVSSDMVVERGRKVDDRTIVDLTATPISIIDAVFLTIAVPRRLAPIKDVIVSASDGGPVPTLERLADRGTPSDTPESLLGSSMAPDIGELWLLIPREHTWLPGSYQCSVVAKETYEFRYRLG